MNKISKISCVLLIAMGLIIISIMLSKNNRKPPITNDVENATGGIGDCDPYEYNMDFIPMQIPSITKGEDTIAFQQILESVEDTDIMLNHLFEEYTTNSNEGIKDCFPEFDQEKKAHFSRISDDDNVRYQTFLNYMGSKGNDLLISLNDMPGHRFEGLECATYQKNSIVDLARISITLYSNVTANVLISKDFSKSKSIYDDSIYQNLIELYNSKDVSKMNGTDMAITYHYQQRIFRKDTDNITEERYIYYTYLRKDDLEYLIQYKSNFTVLEGQKEYIRIGDLQTQEVCRNTLLSLLEIINDI